MKAKDVDDMPKFAHYDLALLNPSFDSPLVDVITELEHLRSLQLAGTTAPAVFMKIKHIFLPNKPAQ